MKNDIEALLNQVRRLYNHIHHLGETLHADEPITLGMRAVLEFLVRNGPATVPEIARNRSVTRQHVQTIVNSLLDAALVELESNPRHKRSSLVTLTPEGSQIIERMRERESRVFDDSELDTMRDEIRAAAHTLEKVRLSLDAKEPRS